MKRSFPKAQMTEQRQDDRQHLEAASLSVIDLESGVEFAGEGRNLSGHGLLFHASMAPPVGADLHVTMQGKRTKVRVLRVEPQAQGGFAVAGRMI